MIHKKISLQSEFNKNVVALFIGTTMAQAIPIAFSPLLTRLYDPIQYGELAMFFAITNVAGIVATGRYELAIVLPKEEDEANQIQRLCYLISLLIGTLLLCVIIAFDEQILQWLDSPGFGFWLYFIPLHVVLMGILQTINARFNRSRKFRQISFTKITQNGANIFISVLLGATNLLKNGLIVGHIIGFLTAVLLFVNQAAIKTKHSIAEIRNVAIKYNHFVTYNAPTALLNTIASTLPIFYISMVASKVEVGFYGLVERVINAPIGIIAYAVSQVLLEDVASRYRDGRPIRKVLFQLLRNLFLIGIIPFSILFFFAEDIFQYAFGPSWKEAGNYASILSIGFFMRFMVSPLSVVFISMNQVRRLTLWQSLYFCSTAGVVIFSYYSQDTLERFLILIAINDVILYSLYIFLIQSIVKK